MGRPAGWMTELTGRSPMKSPGAPSHRREVEREFWNQIATGITSGAAAAAVGVSQAVGTRWFRHGGGMPPMDLNEPTGRYLSFVEREEIALLRAMNYGVRAIAREIGRDPSTVSRELRRNAATRGGKVEYRASVAHWKAELVAKRPKPCKLVKNSRLRAYVQDRLSGAVCDTDGTPIGPQGARWIGRNKPHRGDRRWTRGWSPEQISNRLRVDFPDDETMRISHEAIYQALYIESRGALKRELVHCLRTGRALRVPRARARSKAWAHVTSDVMISERPDEADDRSIPGHWEGDLIIGLKRSAIGTIVDRTTRFTILIHPTRSRLRHDPENEERPGTRRIRRSHDEQGSCCVNVDPARPARPISHLGSRQGTLSPCCVHRRDRDPGVLRRPAQPLATRHERKHQRHSAPVLPERHRPFPLE